MKTRLVILIVVVGVLFSSCAQINFNVEDEMKAPLLSEDQAEIQMALEEFAKGRKIKLVYPKSGAFLAPFIRPKSDSEEAAAVFAIFSIDEGNKKVTKIAMLKKEEKVWGVVSDAIISSGFNCEVEDVSFSQMHKEGNETLLIGWSNQQRRFKEIVAFEYTNCTVEEIVSVDYVDKIVADIDGDGLDELIWIDRPNNSAPCLKVAKIFGSAPEDISYCYAPLKQDKNMIDHSKMTLSKLKNGNMAVFIDEIVFDEKTQKEMMITEIVEYVNHTLANHIYQEEQNLGDLHFDFSEFTLRDKSIKLEDINSDGYLEVPEEQSIFKYQYSSDEAGNVAFKIINWRSLKNGELKLEEVELINEWAAYRLRFSHSWFEDELISPQRQRLKEEITNPRVLISYKDESQSQLLELLELAGESDQPKSILQIYVVASGKHVSEAFEKFAASAQFDYYLHISEESALRYKINKERLREMMKPYNTNSSEKFAFC